MYKHESDPELVELRNILLHLLRLEGVKQEDLDRVTTLTEAAYKVGSVAGYEAALSQIQRKENSNATRSISTQSENTP